MPVIDASVAVKWFVEEAGSPAAHRLLEDHASGQAILLAPDLLVYEVSNVLLHHPIFRVSDIRSCVARLYELEVDLIAPSPELVAATITLAATNRVTFYDALYVQLAQHLEVPFYTADQRLIAKLRNHSFIRSL